jgi:hypothetical protein
VALQFRLAFTELAEGVIEVSLGQILLGQLDSLSHLAVAPYRLGTRCVAVQRLSISEAACLR